MVWLKNEYGKRSKILNNFLDFCSQTNVFRVVIHKMLIRIANREYPDQTVFLEAV